MICIQIENQKTFLPLTAFLSAALTGRVTTTQGDVKVIHTIVPRCEAGIHESCSFPYRQYFRPHIACSSVS